MNGPPQKPITAFSAGSSRAHEPDRLEHRRRTPRRDRDAQPLDVRERPDRPLDHRADALDELDVDSHAEDRGHDVREQHGGVDVVAPDRLQGHLGAELGRARELEEECRSRSARYSGNERPAWRMNQTGVRSTGSRRARAREAARPREGHSQRVARRRLNGAVERVGEHPVKAGPLAVRWLALRTSPRGRE